MKQKSLSFGLLGPLQMRADDILVPLGTPKQRAVLAVLSLNRNRPVAVDSLLVAAWEDAPPSGGRANIHCYVSNLRRLLNSVGVDGKAVLANVAPGYAIKVADPAVDLGRFVTQKTAGLRAAAAGKFEHASRHLSDALSEWRGPVLEDLSDFAFFDAFATALMDERILTQTAHAEAEIACGRSAEIIGELEDVVIEHPYREPLWAQLIAAYYLADRQADALDAYQRLKTTLADELGIDPSSSLQELHKRVLRREPLDVKGSAKTTAAETVISIDQRASASARAVTAHLRDESGRLFPLQGAATRIGRSITNDIVLPGVNVSRYHAVIIDTGASYVITDLRSANGVDVQGRRVQTTAPLADGDRVRIGNHEFTFDMRPAT